MSNISANELSIVVNKAKDMGIDASAFDVIFRMCGGNYYSILYFLSEYENNLPSY